MNFEKKKTTTIKLTDTQKAIIKDYFGSIQNFVNWSYEYLPEINKLKNERKEKPLGGIKIHDLF